MSAPDDAVTPPADAQDNGGQPETYTSPVTGTTVFTEGDKTFIQNRQGSSVEVTDFDAAVQLVNTIDLFNS